MREWNRAAQALVEQPGVGMVVGATDTGKTTLAALLANFCFERGVKVAIVDADVGQSDIGPPGTVGLGLVGAAFQKMREVPMRAAYFVGSNSPEGLLLHAVVGTKRMVEKALSLGAEAVIVDTTGLVFGGASRALKQFKMEALAPRHIFALQRANEIEHLLRPWEKLDCVLIHRLPVSPRARQRSREERRLARERSFRAYFAGSSEQLFRLDSIGFSRCLFGTGRRLDRADCGRLTHLMGCDVLWAELLPEGLYVVTRGRCGRDGLELARLEWNALHVLLVREESFKSLLVAFLDAAGEFLDVGILREVDFSTGVARFDTPLKEVDLVRSVQLGLLKVLPDGREVGKVERGEL